MEYKEHRIHVSTGSIIRTVLVLLFFAMLFVLKGLVLVVLMAVVIASSIEPPTQWLMARKVPRLLAVIMMYVSMAAALVGVIYFLLLPLLSESSSFLRNFPDYFNASRISQSISSNQFLSSQPIVAGLQNSVNVQQIITQINEIIANITSNAFSTITTLFGGIITFLLMIVLSFYLAVEEDGVATFLRIITPLSHEKYVIDLWKRSQRKIGLWMQGQLILAIVIGMLVYLGLLLLNIQNALLFAFLAAAFEIIPLFGPILAAIPAVLLSFVSGGFSAGLLVLGLYIIIHQFENQLIYPLVVKKVVGVSPIISMVALVVGWELGGFLGLVLSVPLATVVIEFFEDLERNKVRTSD